MPLSTAALEPVRIRGSGVAATCCARLLSEAGFPLSLKGDTGARKPAILIGERTQALVTDVFGQPGLFSGLHTIDRRMVAWGRAEPVEVPHRGAVVAESDLVERLGTAGATAEGDPDWTIYASQPTPDFGEQRFGSRTASAAAVELRTSRSSVCWIESLPGGWLFLLPDETSSGWLIAVGAPPGDLLSDSRLVGPQVESVSAEHAVFPAYPRIADPLCGPGWLACGTAAMAFDPLCGDGVGAAVREAILAAAVIRAAGSGYDPEGLLTHYRSRLTAGLLRHLEMCRDYYMAANGGPWWEREIAGLDEGIAWCRAAIGKAGTSRYCLRGFELESIG